VKPSTRLIISLRLLVKAVVVYAAGAWAAIEVVDFAVTKYGLSQWLLDAAVIVAFGGGMITAVLTWYHGPQGQQKITRPEAIIVTTLVVSTAASVIYLVDRGPTAKFDRLDGYRLSFEFSQENYSEGSEPMKSFFIDQMLGLEIVDEDFFFSLEAPRAEIHGPSLDVVAELVPVMYRGLANEELVTITFVLPFAPEALMALWQSGAAHNELEIDQGNFDVSIREPFELRENLDGMAIRFAFNKSRIDLPVTFEDRNVDYSLSDFGGTVTVIGPDPVNVSNTVAATTKTVGPPFIKGTVIGRNFLGFNNPIPFTPTDTVMTVMVLSPAAGINVRLKVENAGDSNIFAEVDVPTTVANAWERLSFDFAGAPGFDPNTEYSKAVIFFDFVADKPGDDSIYYWDNLALGELESATPSTRSDSLGAANEGR
jgi:hypothetical protein